MCSRGGGADSGSAMLHSQPDDVPSCLYCLPDISFSSSSARMRGIELAVGQARVGHGSLAIARLLDVCLKEATDKHRLWQPTFCDGALHGD